METSKELLDITGLDGGSLGQLVKAELDSDSAPDYKFIARCMQNVPYEDVPLFNLAFVSSERKYRTLIEEVSSNITDDPELLKSFQATTKAVTDEEEADKLAAEAESESDEPSPTAGHPRHTAVAAQNKPR